MGLDTKIYWLSDRHSQCDFDVHLNTSRGATRFCPVLSCPNIVQSMYKWYAPNFWCLSRSLCWLHLYGHRSFTFLIHLGPLEAHLILNERNIPFVGHVKYLGVNFDRRITWRLHIEMTKAKAFRTCIRIYTLFKSERLCANIKLTLHKALIKTLMTYACPAWELVAHTFLIKLQRLRNRFLRTIGNLPRCTLVRDAWGYNWATLFLGDINTGTWPSKLEDSNLRQ
jgi:hypothetical protein